MFFFFLFGQFSFGKKEIIQVFEISAYGKEKIGMQRTHHLINNCNKNGNRREIYIVVEKNILL